MNRGSRMGSRPGRPRSRDGGIGVFKQVYKRTVYWKPPCRSLLGPVNRGAGHQWQGRPVICCGARLSWLSVECQRCTACTEVKNDFHSEARMCPLPTKATAESLASSSGSSVKGSSTFASFPELWAFLTCYESPDGGKRQGGKLSLSCERGLWSLALTDPSTSLYACLNAPSLDDLILMVESRLSESTIPWRPSNYTPKGRR
jgi:hypothetical protein